MYLLVQFQVLELMLKDILALMSLEVKLNFFKKMPQVALCIHIMFHVELTFQSLLTSSPRRAPSA